MSVRVHTVFGTRPEAIKLAPVIAEMRRRSDQFEVEVVTTGQHRELLDQVLSTFGITPDHDLHVMKPGQKPVEVLSRITSQLAALLEERRPDIVLVQGDTTTVLAGALAAAHLMIPVGHVEAGLRSGSIQAPFPEEINRRLTSHVASYHFASTERARDNLLREGIDPERIHVTGNTVVDALLEMRAHLDKNPIDLTTLTPELNWNETRVILVTGHRRESFGDGFGAICDALEKIAMNHPEVHIVYPVHLNPQVHDVVHTRLGQRENIHLLPPVEYLPFLEMMSKCHLILSDSGGIQEEAPSLGKPLLVMRERTERPETVEVGGAKLVGTDEQRIVTEVETLLTDDEAHRAMASVENPHGDGHASRRIADFLKLNEPLTLE